MGGQDELNRVHPSISILFFFLYRQELDTTSSFHAESRLSLPPATILSTQLFHIQSKQINLNGLLKHHYVLSLASWYRLDAVVEG
jgi:hypothetical protein